MSSLFPTCFSTSVASSGEEHDKITLSHNNNTHSKNVYIYKRLCCYGNSKITKNKCEKLNYNKQVMRHMCQMCGWSKKEQPG